MKKNTRKNTYQDNYHFAKKNMHFCIDLEWLQLFSLLHFFSVFPPISFNIFSEPYWLVKNQIKCLVFKLFFKKEIDKVSFKDCRKTFFKISIIDYIVILSNLIAQ